MSEEKELKSESGGNVKKQRISTEPPKETPESVKKMTGPLFWVILGLVAIDDILDVFLDATGLGSILASAFSIIILSISIFYMWASGVSLDTRFLIRGTISFIIELIPFLQVLPGGMLFLILTRLYENSPKVRGLVDLASSFRGKKTQPPPTPPRSRGVKKLERLGETRPGAIIRLARKKMSENDLG